MAPVRILHRNEVDAAQLRAYAEDLPPSAQRVFEALLDEGPMTHRELVELLDMPPRTVRFAVSRLKDTHILGERASLKDCRQSIFFLKAEDEDGTDKHPLLSFGGDTPRKAVNAT